MSKPIKVLVVEDSEDDTRLAMLALRRGGYTPAWRRVQDAEGLKQAIEQERWDLVLSDFRLPDFSGVEALHIFRRSGLDIPFIFVSGTIGEETAVEAMKAGASDYVMKQNTARLAAVVRRELEQSAIRSEHRQAQVDLEAERRKHEAQLRHVQKMESVGTLAGGIAHDFNNILGAILGNIQLAREEVGPGHPAQRSLEEIERASLRARNLVRQILTFSRHEPQQLVVQPLAPVVEETRKLLRATLPAGVELDARLDKTPLHVLADATQVQQVLMNLCTNAWHALKPGDGHIRIGLRRALVEAAGAERLGLPQAGVHAHLWVRDNGCGMDAATRERIFEPFFTTKPVGQGTGLGLSVVHGIVTAHHGAIEVESVPGKGSCFHLYFPVVEQDLAPQRAVPAALAASTGHGEHVAYVDDDETMLLMVTRLLEKLGYRAVGYQDAQQALAALQGDGPRPACLITDFNMPGCSGLDIAREAARLQPALPVIISSGYLTEDLQKAAQQVGVRALLEKQNTFEELGGVLSRVLGGEAEDA